VVLFGGGAIGMDLWIDSAGAVLHGWFPGEQGALAIAEIILGITNPCGKLPISIERHWQDSPAFENYIPAGGAYYETPDYTGRPRPTFDVRYEEGIFCGYRHYEHRNIEPLFPFGHGLSYTEFEYSGLSLNLNDAGEVDVTFTVKNTGKLPGNEIAQIYVGEENPAVPRPRRELKGFESIELKPGERKAVNVRLGKRDFSYYDVDTKKWRMEPGVFRIMAGASVKDIRLEETIAVIVK